MSPVLLLSSHTPPTFPLGMASGFYCALGMLVVHLCQQLVEQTSHALDPASRRVRASRAALSIGGLVWVLDVSGFYIYPGLDIDRLGLAPALLALLLDVFAARLTVPSLSTDTNAWHVALSAIGLTLGLLFGHALLSLGFMGLPLLINLQAILFSVGLAAALAVALALKHRQARLSVVSQRFTPLSWRDKLLAGCVILPLHWYLVCTFPIPIMPLSHGHGDPRLLLTVLAFGLGIIADLLLTMRSERDRQLHLRRAMSPRFQGSALEAQQRDNMLALIATRLPALLQAEQLQVHFQPIINAQHQQRHAEALLRVTDPVLGRINPEQFFLACELQQCTSQADRMVISNCLDHLTQWSGHAQPPMTINVNVAPVTLLEPSFPAWLSQQLQQRALPYGTLRLEITEHALIANGADMIQVMHQLKAFGVGVVMDDFGSGYSSLGLLADLPISGFKCDRLFIKQLTSDPRRQALLRHIAELASDLSIPVTAEGVETEEELNIVLLSGISSIQGYVFARPMPATELPHWYRQGGASLSLPLVGDLLSPTSQIQPQSL